MPRGQYDRTVRAQVPDQVKEPEAVLEQSVSPRAAEMRRERRRRDDGDLDRMANQKLAIPREIQEQMRREGKVVRWIMDTRMVDAHANDWDRVEGIEPIQANPMAGTEERLVLCSKYADWDAADRTRDDMTVDAIEERAMAGQLEGDGKSSAGLRVPTSVTNRVTTQRGL